MDYTHPQYITSHSSITSGIAPPQIQQEEPAKLQYPPMESNLDTPQVIFENTGSDSQQVEVEVSGLECNNSVFPVIAEQNSLCNDSNECYISSHYENTNFSDLKKNVERNVVQGNNDFPQISDKALDSKLSEMHLASGSSSWDTLDTDLVDKIISNLESDRKMKSSRKLKLKRQGDCKKVKSETIEKLKEHIVKRSLKCKEKQLTSEQLNKQLNRVTQRVNSPDQVADIVTGNFQRVKGKNAKVGKLVRSKLANLVKS